MSESEFWLDRLTAIGLEALAERVRTSLPSKARSLLEDALSENEREQQKYMLKHKCSHTKFTDRETLIKAALLSFKHL